jgi:hypothetical protein
MDVVVTGGGVPAGSPNTPSDLVIDATFGAARMSLRPDDYQVANRIMGHYSAAGFTAATLSAAGGIMAAFRYGDVSSVAVIKRVRVAAAVVAAVTAQQVDCDLIVARSYTVRDLTSATVVPVTGDTGKMRQGMGPSLLATLAGGNFDVASAAAGLTGGTKTVDASPIASAPVPLVAFTAGAASPWITLYDCNQSGQHPLVLKANEGILVRNTTVIGTGTLRYYVVIDWLEAAGY